MFEFEFFDAIEMCPQDPMHIILEGIARRLIIDYMKLWAQIKRVTLQELNARIRNFEYGFYLAKDKIKFIIKEHDLLRNEIIMTASQMKALLILLPFIFYDIIDTNSPDYKLLNLLRKITMLTFAYSQNESKLDRLEKYIEKFIQMWDETFGSGFPKLHYLIHIPNWIRK